MEMEAKVRIGAGANRERDGERIEERERKALHQPGSAWLWSEVKRGTGTPQFLTDGSIWGDVDGTSALTLTKGQKQRWIFRKGGDLVGSEEMDTGVEMML